MGTVSHAGRARASGLALLETLITLLVLALGLVLAVRLQQGLWRAADEAGQRAEALHLAREDLERLRHHAALETGGAFSWADIATAAAVEVTDRSSATVYTLGRTVSTGSGARLKTGQAEVTWTDRTGQAQALGLLTAWAGLEPRLSGWVALAPDGSSHAAVQGRHPAIPLSARDLGNGRSAFKPRADVTLTWVFDHTTGHVVQRCDGPLGQTSVDLSTAALSNCVGIDGLLLAGTVRFATAADTVTIDDARAPVSTALDLDMALSLTSTGHPSPPWVCLDDSTPAPSARLGVRYWCVVQPAGAPPRWSGRLNVVPVGWTLAASGAGAYRVCRYSADLDHDGRIGNAEHPASYSAVSQALTQQNFLVIRAAATCPVEATPAGLDASTAAHQP